MKLKLYALLSVFFMALGASAQIVKDDPVIDMGADGPNYIKFVGTNTTNNYRYILDTFEGTKFRLTLESLNPKIPAVIPESDKNDENYWEPLFRYYTKQMAGEEMEASRNIKELYVKGVALFENQFKGYCDGMKKIEITSDGDYQIPSGCFAKGEAEGYSIKSLTTNVKGKLSLGADVVDATAGGLSVYTEVEQNAKAWQSYKTNNNAVFSLYLNNEPYTGEGEDTTPAAISSLTVSYILNGNATSYPVPNEETKLKGDDFNGIMSFVLKGYTATVTRELEELFMDYAVYPDADGGAQHGWTALHATYKGDNVWAFEQDVDVLANTEKNTTYNLEFSISTNPIDGKDREHFPNNGAHIRIKFTTGDYPEGITIQKVEVVGNPSVYDVQGRRVSKEYRGVIIKDGKKISKTSRIK